MIRSLPLVLALLATPALCQQQPVPEVFRLSGPALMELDYFAKDLEQSLIARQVRRHLTRTTDRTAEDIAAELAPLSHDEMLARWLEFVDLGRNCAGIDAAMEAYFGATPEEASLQQALTLMALVRSPEAALGDAERLERTYAYLIEQVLRIDGLTFEEAQTLIEAGAAEINSAVECDG